MKAKKIRWNKWNRVVHYWGAFACAIPLLIVTVTGILLLLKKESSWIQPPTQRGVGETPEVSFEKVIGVIKTVPQAGVVEWKDIHLLDVRPSKGVIKVRSKNGWEVQLDSQTCEVLQVAYRRSDTIESLHDGTFFHDSVKLWIFLPSAVILFVLWVTGMYLFVVTWWNKRKRRRKNVQKV